MEKLRALPTDVIKVDGGAVLRRDCTVLRVHGEGVEKILNVLFALAGEGGMTRAELTSSLASSFPGIEQATDRLLGSLINCRILIEDGVQGGGVAPETTADIFFWNFDANWSRAARSLAQQYILVLGVNALSLSIARALAECGTQNYDVADRPSLRGPGFFAGTGELIADKWSGGVKQPLGPEALDDMDMTAIGCIVAATDTGAQHLLRPLNRYAVDHKVPFLPVVLRDHVGQVGPLVIAGETACLECLRARQNANHADAEGYRVAELPSEAGTWAVGYHPMMTAMLGNVVAMELSKQFAGTLPHRNVGTMIEIKLLEPSVTRRKILKVPRCVACGTTGTVSAENLDKKEYIPDPPPST